MSLIAILDYEGGNLASVANAVRYLGREALITNEADQLRKADKIIFPGVGIAEATMAALKKNGLDKLLREELTQVPCLGICIGIQVLFDHSEEGDIDTLGIIPGQVRRFPKDEKITVPQIGWNRARVKAEHPFFKGVGAEEYYYFVNSYFVEPKNDEVVLARTDYGSVNFASVVAYKNWIATQFHLEKSGRAGLQLLDNFLKL